jgi:hypothetical protein
MPAQQQQFQAPEPMTVPADNAVEMTQPVRLPLPSPLVSVYPIRNSNTVRAYLL